LQNIVLRNVVTHFSQLHFFLVFRPLRNIFPAHLLMYIANFLFIRKIKHFATNWWDRFLKYVSVVQIYGTFENRSKQFSWFSIQNRHCTSTKTNLKNLFLQFLGTSFSFILKQIPPLSVLPCTGKIFRAKSSVFRTICSITSQLWEMIGSIFYHMLVMLLFRSPEIFIDIRCTV
jgi:hypothetical protein